MTGPVAEGGQEVVVEERVHQPYPVVGGDPGQTRAGQPQVPATGVPGDPFGEPARFGTPFRAQLPVDLGGDLGAQPGEQVPGRRPPTGVAAPPVGGGPEPAVRGPRMAPSPAGEDLVPTGAGEHGAARRQLHDGQVQVGVRRVH
ncbi:hypothetical protein Misp04_24660 [Micromonospora sp. NBRC 101691]|nr:hypothetical protein [Micromonospora sp. NBRC 101691]GLY22734.1 hypothetical protein Misp04_24660 [Micromonospora sp. NBRC 101691]